MARSVESPLDSSLASAIGLLYQRKQAGAALIRVLERYQRSDCHPPSTSRPMVSVRGVRGGATAAGGRTRIRFQQKLEQLYLRRAVVDELIRSIEAYSQLTPSIAGKRAGPQANH